MIVPMPVSHAHTHTLTHTERGRERRERGERRDIHAKSYRYLIIHKIKRSFAETRTHTNENQENVQLFSLLPA